MTLEWLKFLLTSDAQHLRARAMGKKRGGTKKCWHCGEAGHAQSECAALQSESGVRRCFVCGSDEHEAMSCLQNTRPPKEQRPWATPVVGRVVTNGDAPSASSRMTVVVTTSPVPSNPSTLMLEAVLRSFHRVKGLTSCPLVIVCDGYNINSKSTFKAGRVTEEAASNYHGFLQNLESLLTSGALPKGTRLVFLEGRNGQAMGVRAGLAQVETPHVLIHQHDLEFMFDFDMERVLNVLDDENNNVKYVGLPLLCNIHYERYAKSHHDVLVEPVVEQGVHLVPIVFWYDSTHVTSVQHYNDLIFAWGEFRAGDFIEETFGVRQRKDIIDNGMIAHSKYGTHHLISHSADGSRRPIICHLGGNRFLTPEQRAARGYPAETPVENYPTRTTTHKSKRRVGRIIDAIVALAGAPPHAATPLRTILNCQLHQARLRLSPLASECLARAGIARV